MCGEKGFAEDRVRNGAKKLMKARQGSTQGRLDSFFKVMPAAATPNGKRKSEEIKNGSASKKAKAANGAKKGFFKR
jgi:flap endonuclease-1